MNDRRFAWWLVWAYPPRFRRDVGLGLVDALDDRMRAERAAGVSSLRIRGRAALDTLRNAAAAWVHAVGRGRRRYALRASQPGGRTMLDRLQQDVRYALRLWNRRRAVAFVAIVTLALGIGANTAMFSIVNAVLLRPLPYPDADRLVSIWSRTATFPRGLLSYAEYEAVAAEKDTFAAAALQLSQSINLTGSAEPQRLIGVFATGTFFDVLGLEALRGRLFSEQESVPGSAAPVVVLSRTFWRQRFNEAPSALGATLTINGTPLTIIGVLAPPDGLDTAPGDGGFIGADVFIPAGLLPVPHGLRAAGPVMLALARTRPGVPLERVRPVLATISQRLAAVDPNAAGGRTLIAESAHDAVVGSSRPMLLLLFAGVAAVLLIACVNVSQLLLARAVDRQREIALRAALGATAGTVVRQLIVEAALLALVSCAIGVVIGRWLTGAFAALRPAGLPMPARIPVDGTVLAFTAVVAVLVAGISGVAPAVRAARADIVRALQASVRTTSGTGRTTRDLLVVVEIALSVALVAIAVLLMQSLNALRQAPLGFDPSNVFTLQFRLPAAKYRTPDDIARFFHASIDRVRAIPGVESAALVRAVPFSGNGGTEPYSVEGRPSPDGASAPQSLLHLVTPDYFRTMRIPLLQGRDFTDRDDLQAPLVAIVNETLAKRAWPDESPIGRRLIMPDAPGPATVVAVVGDAKHYSAAEPPTPQIYVSHFQVPLIFCSLVARTSVPPMTIANDVRRAIWSVDKDQPVWAVLTLQEQIDRTQGQSRVLAVLLGVFAGIALLLAAVGIYGVTSYAVAQRTHEIGIRLALGASGGRVRKEIIARAMKLTAGAVALGVACAIAAARLASAVLVGVTPTDPAALAASATILAGVSMAAAYLPARRASRVDPVVALADE